MLVPGVGVEGCRSGEPTDLAGLGLGAWGVGRGGEVLSGAGSSLSSPACLARSL